MSSGVVIAAPEYDEGKEAFVINYIYNKPDGLYAASDIPVFVARNTDVMLEVFKKTKDYGLLQQKLTSLFKDHEVKPAEVKYYVGSYNSGNHYDYYRNTNICQIVCFEDKRDTEEQYYGAGFY